MSSVAVVGPGRMGLALADGLVGSGGLSEVTVFGRRPEPPRHPVFGREGLRYVYGLEPLPGDCLAVFLAVPDDAVPEVAHQVAAQGPAPERCAAFHLSGALPSDLLAPLHAAGFGVGVFHPWIVASRSPSGAERLRGACIAVTASPEAYRTASEVASLLGASVIQIPAARRALAHAAVTLIEGYLPALVDTALPLLDRVGLDRDEGTEALIGLLRSVLMEIEEQGTEGALRTLSEHVDPEALDVHLRALDGEERRLYAWLRSVAASRSASYRAGPGDEAAPPSHHEHASKE